MNCPNCNQPGSHFVPPSMGEAGFYVCQERRMTGDKTLDPRLPHSSEARPAQCQEHRKTEAQERAAFEAWIRTQSYEHSLKRWDAAPVPHWTDQYVNLSTQLAWEAWRAAKAGG